MITGIIGHLGCGKTATAVYIAHLRFLAGDLIFCNFPLFFEHIPISHPAHLVFISELAKEVKCNSVVVLDEAWRWISSALSQAKVQLVLSHIYTRSRKEDWDLVYTTQRFRNVQVRLRHITDTVLIPSPQPIYKKVPDYFRVSITDNQGYMDGVTPFTFELDYVKDLFHTKAECYGYEDIHKSFMEILAEKSLEQFALGNVNKEEEIEVD